MGAVVGVGGLVLFEFCGGGSRVRSHRPISGSLVYLSLFWISVLVFLIFSAVKQT